MLCGQLINLISTDASRLNDMMFMPMVHWGLWVPILSICVALYFLYVVRPAEPFMGLH